MADVECALRSAFDEIEVAQQRGGMMDVSRMREIEQIILIGMMEQLVRSVDWDVGNPTDAVQYAIRLQKFLVEVVISPYSFHLGYEHGVVPKH